MKLRLAILLAGLLAGCATHDGGGLSKADMAWLRANCKDKKFVEQLGQLNREDVIYLLETDHPELIRHPHSKNP